MDRIDTKACLEAGQLREKHPNYEPVTISLHQSCLLPMHSVGCTCSNLSFHACACGEVCKV